MLYFVIMQIKCTNLIYYLATSMNPCNMAATVHIGMNDIKKAIEISWKHKWISYYIPKISMSSWSWIFMNSQKINYCISRDLLHIAIKLANSMFSLVRWLVVCRWFQIWYRIYWGVLQIIISEQPHTLECLYVHKNTILVQWVYLEQVQSFSQFRTFFQFQII